MSETTRKSFQSKLADFFAIHEETSQKEKQAIGMRLKDFNIPVPDALLSLQKERRENEALINQMVKLLSLGFGDAESAAKTTENVNALIATLDEQIKVEQAKYEESKTKARENVFNLLVNHYNS